MPHATRAWLILRYSSHLTFLPSVSYTHSQNVPVVIPTQPVPLVRRGFAPLRVVSSPARGRSRLYARTETFIGVVSVTSRSSLEWIAHSTGRTGRSLLSIPNYYHLLIQNSKLGPHSKFEIMCMVCGRCESPKFKIVCLYPLHIISVRRLGSRNYITFRFYIAPSRTLPMRTAAAVIYVCSAY